jgi:hypothetical protein
MNHYYRLYTIDDEGVMSASDTGIGEETGHGAAPTQYRVTIAKAKTRVEKNLGFSIISS